MNWNNLFKRTEKTKRWTNVCACVELLKRLGINPANERHWSGIYPPLSPQQRKDLFSFRLLDKMSSEPSVARQPSDSGEFAIFMLGVIMAIAGFATVPLCIGGYLSIGGELAGLAIGIFGVNMALAFRR